MARVRHVYVPNPGHKAGGARLLVTGLLCALAAAAGLWCRATYGAQVTADEPQYLLSAISIAEDGDLDIADELAAQRWRPFHEAQLPEQTKPLPGGRRVSPHDPLLPLLLAPAVAAGGWVGGKLTLAAIAGLLGAATLWVAVRRFGVSVGVATLAVVVFGASLPLAAYGHQVYPELVAALVVVAGAGALTGPLKRGGLWLLGSGVVALPWLAVKYVPVAGALAAIGLVRLWRRGDRAGAMGLGAGLAAAGLVFLGLHQAVYGGWTPYAAGDHFVTGEFGVVGFHPDYVGRGQRLVGLLMGRKFGIAAWQPAWLFAVPAVAALLRQRPAGWPVIVAPVAAGWLNATFVALTAQGYWVPGRQIVVILGLVVIAVAWWVDRVRAWSLFTAAGLVGIVSYGWLVVETSTGRLTLIVDFWRTANPLYQAWKWALPDYVAENAWTWPLHWAWAVALVGLLALGSRLTSR